MKRVLLLCLAFLSSPACGGDPCEDAADKLDECGFADEYGVTEGECSGLAECQASCIADASCSDLEEFDEESDFWACLADCEGSE